MEQNKYSQVMAANGRLGGLAKAKNQAPLIYKKYKNNAELVFDYVLDHPFAKQAEIAEALGLSQSFVSEVMFPHLKILRIQAQQGLILDKNQIKQEIKKWQRQVLKHLKIRFPSVGG